MHEREDSCQSRYKDARGREQLKATICAGLVDYWRDVCMHEHKACKQRQKKISWTRASR